MSLNTQVTYGQSTLADGIRSRQINNGNGLSVHVLEAGDPGKPGVLLLHGFPELAYSWRHILLPLAEAGYHVMAPDQRGYGRTAGWDADYDGDLASFRMLNLVQDACGLLEATGHKRAAVIGHDFGSPVAAWCALTRPDIFRSAVLMSSPFGGPPSLTKTDTDSHAPTPDIQQDLAALDPPRKHYQWYYATREANQSMWGCTQGVHDFLRAYYHCKSADWEQNQPYPLASWSAAEIARLPRYYVMDFGAGMAETVAPEMPSPDEIALCQWLPDESLRVYSEEYGRLGFQGGLQWYRCATGSDFGLDLQAFSGRTIDVPTCYVAGRNDWGTYQKPGSLERMQSESCSDFRGVSLVEGAGHWVQQEQHQEVSRILIDFLSDLNPRSLPK